MRKLLLQHKKSVFLLCGLLACFLICSGATAVIAASEGMKTERYETEKRISYPSEESGILQTGDLLEQEESLQLFASGNTRAIEKQDYTEVEAVIAAALERGETLIDISDFQLPSGTKGFYSHFANTHPQYFYLGGSCRYWTSGGYIISVELTLNPADESTRKKMIASYEEKISEILANVNPSWSDLEKVLYIHDYLAIHVEYDTTLQKYTAYDAIVEGVAVCQGYSLAFQDLMNRLGIPCELVSSESLNHAWNLVQIGDAWYHVDTTWDDPVSDRYGRVNHTFLLKSTDWFQNPTKKGAISHKAADYQYSGSAGSSAASDKRFDTYFWNDVESPFGYYEGSWYANAGGDIKQYSGNQSGIKETMTLANLKDVWYLWENKTKYYVGNYGSSSVLGNTLYYATPTEILSLDLTKEKPTAAVAFTPSKKELETGYIYGFYIDQDGKLHYEMRQGPSAASTKYQTTFHTHEFESWEITTEPTCTKSGERRQNCSSCGWIKSDVIAATGHTSEASALCSEAQTCVVCGEEIAEKERHRSTITRTVAATFLKTGKQTVTCRDCGKVLESKLLARVKCEPDQIYTVGNYKYKIVSAKTDGTGTVSFTGLAKSVKKVTIANTVTILGVKFKVVRVANKALKNKTSVTSVTIGKNVSAIGKEAFYGTKNLKTITIQSAKLKKVGESAFSKIYAKAKITVPKEQLSSYKKLLKGKGQANTVTIQN